MAIKYSIITREQVCYLQNGLLYVTTIDGQVFTVEVGNNWTMQSTTCTELTEGQYLAVCENMQARFILYPNLLFNVIRLSDNLLLDYGSVQSFNKSYVFSLIGSAWYKGSYKGVFIEKSTNLVYVSNNLQTPFSLRFEAGILSNISSFDESYCLSICREYNHMAVCGDARNTFMLNLENGEVTR